MTGLRIEPLLDEAAAPDKEFVPFALPDIGEAEIAEVVDALRSGWVTTGPKTRQFESDFKAYMAGNECAAVNSATAGLHLALEAVGVHAGDEVIVPTYTFTSTAEVVRYLGADPVFVDIDPRSLNMDVGGLDAATTRRTKAIVPVHFAGLACDMDPILEYAHERGLAVVEDAAHALPTTYHGRRIGTLGTEATVFSFYATKTMTTGEGGMVVTPSAALAARCRTMRLHGISRDAFDRYTSRTPAWSYEVIAPGFKYNMTDIASSIGIHQLRRVETMRTRRAQIAAYYDESFRDLPLELPAHAQEGDVHAWHLYVVRLKGYSRAQRDAFIDSMAARGVGCSVHFIPLHMQPYWRDRYKLRPESFPVATSVFERVVSLPIYTRMTLTDVQRVVRTVRDVMCER